MADKNIRELPEAEELEDESMLAVAQQGTAMKLTGKKLRSFAEGALEKFIQGAGYLLSIGKVTTGAAGSEAKVTNSGTAQQPVLDFIIPQGEKGDKGDPGGVESVNGQTGAVTVTPENINAVPKTRKVNNKALSADISLSAADVGAVAKTGDTMTGDLTLSGTVRSIKFSSGTRNGTPITFYGKDASGSGMVIGDGGRTIIGGGEAAQSLRTALGTDKDSAEEMHVGSDGSVYIHTNCNQNGANNRKTFTFGTNGALTMPDGTDISNPSAAFVSRELPASGDIRLAGNGVYMFEEIVPAGRGFPSELVGSFSHNIIMNVDIKIYGANGYGLTLLWNSNNNGLYYCGKTWGQFYEWIRISGEIKTEGDVPMPGPEIFDDIVKFMGGMILEEGRFYSDGGVVYRCTRSTEEPVYTALAELVGLYVEVAEN